MRVQNDNNGKSSYWVINPDAKPGKSNRRRSGSIDGQPKGEKKRRTKKLHQSTDDISALSPSSMKFKQNRSFDNLFNIGSPCSSTDSLSNIDDFHGPDVGFPYNSEAFGRPRSTSNVSNVSSVSGRMTPTQLDIDAELEQSNLSMMPASQMGGVADETANMVESMSIDPQQSNQQQQRNMGSINLNDSLKIMKTNEMGYAANNPVVTNTDPSLPQRRPHSDSFGSGDSGYESPAYFSPPQGGQGRGNMGKLPSPGSSKPPPPPYNQAFGNQLNRPNPMFNAGRMNNFYPQQQQQQQQQQQTQSAQSPQNRLGINSHMVTAPRLTHHPMQAQQSYTPNQSIQQPFNNFSPAGAQSMQQMSPGHYSHNNMVAPNVSMDTAKMYTQSPQAYQQQVQPQQFMKKTVAPSVNIFGAETDIPADLSHVELCDFGDQQQLASDIDAIIKNELNPSRSSLQNIYGSPNSNANDSNNNRSNMQGSNSFPLTGQNWVR